MNCYLMIPLSIIKIYWEKKYSSRKVANELLTVRWSYTILLNFPGHIAVILGDSLVFRKWDLHYSILSSLFRITQKVMNSCPGWLKTQ